MIFVVHLPRPHAPAGQVWALLENFDGDALMMMGVCPTFVSYNADVID